MRSILVSAFDDSGLDARLQVGADIVRAFNGHMTCLNATPYEMAVPGDIYGSAFAAMIPIMREAAEALEKQVSDHLQKEDFAWSFINQAGTAEDRLLAHSSLNDLLVIGADEPRLDGKSPSPTVSAIAVKSRTPLLVVPNNQKSFPIDAPAVVAWNGSTEACNALRAALPLLKQSKQVYLLCAKEKKQKRKFDLPPLDGANYLSRHDVSCEIVELPESKAHLSDQLLDAAALREAGYLVMGAYGSSRLSETILGGVTRKMLSDVKLPLLLAH